LGYRKYARDYEIEYVEQPGKKRPKAVRIYVGEYYSFAVSPDRVRWLRWFYLIGITSMALLLLIPLCVVCPFTMTWYIPAPLVAAWIPLVYAAAAVWRLWTAGEKVNQEHYDLLYERMCGACMFLMGFAIVAVTGCILQLSKTTPTGMDLLVCVSCLGAAACAVMMFSKRKELEMVPVGNPEKRQIERKDEPETPWRFSMDRKLSMRSLCSYIFRFKPLNKNSNRRK